MKPSLAKLGPFDGRVAAHVNISSLPCFITSNTRYIPALPSGSPNTLCLRRDMRYGPNDPTLWPQEYSADFCHLGAIPRKPMTQRGKDVLRMMWWDPEPKDFVSPESGLTLTRGLGKLSHSQCSRLAQPVNALLEEYTAYTQTINPPAQIVPLMCQLAQSLRLGVTNMQRCYLELTGMLRYMSLYKPQMEDPNAEPGLPDDCMGVFTSDPIVTQQFRIARLPFWFIQPLSTFLHENILSIVIPQEPIGKMELEVAPGHSPVSVSSNLEQRMRSLHLCTQSTPWYKDLFKQPVSPPEPSSSSQTVPPTREPVRCPKDPKDRPSPYAQAKKTKQSRNPPKIERDKFLVFPAPEMPPSIESWAKALSEVKRSQPPTCGAHIQNRYMFPEPLLISTADESCRQMLLHHYQLMCDVLMYRLGDPNDLHHPLTVQEWCDILQGKVSKQGKMGTRAEVQSASIEAVLGPAMCACEMVWEVVEINFRFELLGLDARASGLDRPDKCKQCFLGNALVGFNIGESKLGFAATNTHDRLPYILHLAGLMLDWKPCPRPGKIQSAFQRLHPEWKLGEINALEKAVAAYYTQCFYDLFGRAAVVPMHLAHEFGT
ncbi:hypothetical protein B0H13DRAFT_2334695 [Mycena leptocephala]|nr:hypothetical protein B0H13DRAFT_2334695 [Mycena leptocephala]